MHQEDAAAYEACQYAGEMGYKEGCTKSPGFQRGMCEVCDGMGDIRDMSGYIAGPNLDRCIDDTGANRECNDRTHKNI